MNRYPFWKYAVLALALLIGLVYAAPNVFGEAPAVQVSSGKATLKLDAAFTQRVEQVLAAAGLKADFVQFDGNSVKARFTDTDAQLKAKDALGRALNPDPADFMSTCIRKCTPPRRSSPRYIGKACTAAKARGERESRFSATM